MPGRPVYSDDEVSEILRRAIERQQQSNTGLRRDELVAAAAEIGIDATYVDHAIDEIEAEKRERREGARIASANDDEAAIRRRLRHRFYRHAATWLIVSTALFLMNALSSPGTWWFYWPLIGWGIGVGIDGVNSLFPSESKIEKEQERIHRRGKKKRRRDREFELAVERGVEKMLSRSIERARVELPAAPKRVARAESEMLEDEDDLDATEKKRAAR